ncbi:GNAT family N-acetyltransferase [Natronoglomus mannanivorans]|uniref:GNAT family N-acetyltransferase n=1 Tax=Natronoglomus mannanivorans TaxID=2979990 RepID=A0AAP2YXX6_9EURY|nr:GNAT family N-acetyltransferase [Halobacteria archaeon AArc-xg1-1]
MDLEPETELEIEIRRATPDDYEAVVEMTSDIWADRGGDYLPEIYHDWLEDEGAEDKKTFVAEVSERDDEVENNDADGDGEGEGEDTADGDLAGIVQGVMLSPEEAWFQSMRVDSDYRRMGVSQRLNEACFEWASGQGATVGRVMIFSWNAPSLGAARTGGFEPVTEFRWAHPDPDPNASSPDGYATTDDAAAAWRYWTDSATREHLGGLALAPEESWALRELTREDLEEQPVFATVGEGGVCAMAYRNRTYERTTDDGEVRRWAEYGVGAWDDVGAARSLFAAIARDAADLEADETRVCIPETATAVSDAAYTAGGISEEPDFVLEIDLTSRR